MTNRFRLRRSVEDEDEIEDEDDTKKEQRALPYMSGGIKGTGHETPFTESIDLS